MGTDPEQQIELIRRPLAQRGKSRLPGSTPSPAAASIRTLGASRGKSRRARLRSHRFVEPEGSGSAAGEGRERFSDTSTEPGASTPVPERLRTCSAGSRTGCSGRALGLSLLVLVAGALLVPGAVPARGAASRHPRRRRIFGNALLGCAARGSAPKAGVPAMVLAARATRPCRLVSPHRAQHYQHRPEPRLDDLRGARHRHRRARRSRSTSCTGPRWLWKLVCGRRSGRRRSAWLGPDRVRPPLGEASSRSWVAARLARLSDVVDAARSRQPRRALVAARARAASARSGRGSTSWSAAAGLVAAAFAADYTRFARTRVAVRSGSQRSATSSPTSGALGARRDPDRCSRGLSDAQAVITAIAAVAAPEPRSPSSPSPRSRSTRRRSRSPNIYSTAVSFQNILPRVSQRVLILGVAVVATWRARSSLDLVHYQDFLYLLGSFFVPLFFGVLLAHWLTDRAHYTPEHAFADSRVAAGCRSWRGSPVSASTEWLAPVRSELLDAPRRAHPIRARERHRRRRLPSFASLLRPFPRAYSCRSCGVARRHRSPVARPDLRGRAPRIGGAARGTRRGRCERSAPAGDRGREVR